MITEFLDVELNLNDISYKPYRKPNSNIMYINKNSSHPKNIIKQIPNIINDRLNKRSSTQENFLKVKSDYESIMEKCGYKEKLHYNNSEQNTKKTSTIFLAHWIFHLYSKKPDHTGDKQIYRVLKNF